MTYEDLVKAKAGVCIADQLLIETEIAYLQAQGCTMVVDQKSETIRWTVPYHYACWSSSSPCCREEAVTSAIHREKTLRREAKSQIEKLKADHNIQD